MAATAVLTPALLLLLACAAVQAPVGATEQLEASMSLIDTNRLFLQRPRAHAPPLVRTPWPHGSFHTHATVHVHAPPDVGPDDSMAFQTLQHYHPDPELLLEFQPDGAYLGPDYLDIGGRPGPGFPAMPAGWPAVPAGPSLPGGFGGQKLELSLGPCVLQLYEPCRDSGHIVFYLFSSVDGRPAVLSVDDPKLPETYHPEWPTKVLIHGFAGSVDFNFTASVRQAYLLRTGYNVLVVDWGRLTQLPCYASSVINTWQVARCAGQLLWQLGRLSAPLQPRSLHVVGFSLGAHIAAFLSADLQARTGQRLARITGLDPALPAFASLSPSWKLDPGDADFVDVVHTNAGVLGKVEPTGHADFYVNGGSVQPFCTDGHRNIPLCSHLLAPVYFAETILDESSHWGRLCASYSHYAWGWCPSPAPEEAVHAAGTLMGEGADHTYRGVFIVETAATIPFALGPPQPVSPPPRPSPPPPTPPETIFVVLSRRRK